MKTIMTEEGLLIPREELDRLGEYVVENFADHVTVRAKNEKTLPHKATQENSEMSPEGFALAVAQAREMTEKTRGMAAGGSVEFNDQLMEDIELGCWIFDEFEEMENAATS